MLSHQESSVRDFISSLGLDTEYNDRTIIKPYELDIVIPQLKIAIEYCGLYWHSEKKLDKNYHKMKLDACNAAGYRLITIFEDEWMNNREIITAKLSTILGKSSSIKISGRKCTIHESDDVTNFLDVNHIQGNVNHTCNYSLRHDDIIVAVMTFTKRGYGYELTRYATSMNVRGGFSKLLSAFIRQHNNMTIKSFADLRWSCGDLYANTNWTFDKKLPPDYSYVISGNRHHKFGFRHKSLNTKLKNYDSSLTEHQNMINHEIFRIYDCGKNRYSMTI